MHRTYSHRLPITLAVLVFVPMSCFGDCSPEEHECLDDKGCPSASVCREDTDGCGDSARRCVSVTECTSDADCPGGEPCFRREAEPAEHPFERSIEEHGVCGCDEEENCEPFDGTTTATGAGGDATGGGSPTGGGFSPATSVTVGATSSQTGSGGAASSTSSGAGGASGGSSASSGGGEAPSTSGTGGAGGST